MLSRMEVSADYICEHEMPQPWVTCTDCMLLPHDQQPIPPRPKPAPPKPAVTKRKRKAASARSPKRTRSAATRSPTALPRSVDDATPALFGDKDLAYEIPDTNLSYHAQGADKDWLPISSMPTELRKQGWVYLKIQDRLVARCQVKGIGYRDRRWSHEHTDTASDAGPGPTLELDGSDWQFVSISLGPDSNAKLRGYRYLITESDGSVHPPVSEVDPGE